MDPVIEFPETTLVCVLAPGVRDFSEIFVGRFR